MKTTSTTTNRGEETRFAFFFFFFSDVGKKTKDALKTKERRVSPRHTLKPTRCGKESVGYVGRCLSVVIDHYIT